MTVAPEVESTADELVLEPPKAVASVSAEQAAGTIKVDFSTAVIASASIPIAFPPVSIGGELYVDGGCRETIPVQAAIDLGATHVYVVSPGHHVAFSTSFRSAFW